MINRNIKITPDYVHVAYLTNYKYLKKILAERAAQKIKAKVYELLDNNRMEVGDTIHLTYDLKCEREYYKKFLSKWK